MRPSTGILMALILGLCFVLSGQTPAQAAKHLSFEQAFLGQGERLTQSLPWVWGWLNDNQLLLMEGGKMRIHEVSSRKSLPFLSPQAEDALKARGLSVSGFRQADGGHGRLLFSCQEGWICLERSRGTLTPLTGLPTQAENPTFSPDGKHLAFTLGGNLHLYSFAEGSSRPLTEDGSETILNGRASWVYYEEILGRAGRYRAFWWSPDSRELVFLRSDDNPVPLMTLTHCEGDYGQVEQQRYPKAGKPNPSVSLWRVTLDQPAHPTPLADGQPDDAYLAFPAWSPDGKALFWQWMDRDQTVWRLFRLLDGAQEPAVVLEEKRATWLPFLEEDHLRITGGEEAFFLSSRTGRRHLYHWKAGRVTALTEGKWDCRQILHVGKRSLLLSASPRRSTDTGLYRIPTRGGALREVAATPGVHRASVSPSGSWITDTSSSLTSPPLLRLLDQNGKSLRILAKSDTPVRQSYRLSAPELFTFQTPDGLTLPATRTLPPDLDPKRRYPVLIQVYGGPGSQTVFNSYPRGLGDAFMAQEGVVVVNADHRGSGHLGQEGMDAMHRQLGRWEMADFCALVDHLRTLPYVDPDRIAITGGSYGGYVSALAIVKHPEHFRCGLAHFSVTDWKLYDSVYTERYMDRPQDNPEGYRQASVLSWIDRYKGGLLLTHGTLDDNVHIQNSLQLVNALLEAGKSLEFMPYPGERHGYRSKREAYARQNWEFLRRHLLDPQEP